MDSINSRSYGTCQIVQDVAHAKQKKHLAILKLFLDKDQQRTQKITLQNVGRFCWTLTRHVLKNNQLFSLLNNLGKRALDKSSSFCPSLTEQKSIESSEKSTSAFADLPHELLVKIFSELTSAQDLLSCSLTCKEWKIASSEKSLWTRIKIIEKETLLPLYGEKIINAFGGFDKFYSLPVLTLEQQKRWKPIGMCGSVPLEEVTAPVMRGIYCDGTQFVVIRFSYQENEKTYENAIILYPGNLLGKSIISTSTSNGYLYDIFVNRTKTSFTSAKDFNLLGEFIKNKQYKDSHTNLTFTICAPKKIQDNNIDLKPVIEKKPRLQLPVEIVIDIFRFGSGICLSENDLIIK